MMKKTSYASILKNAMRDQRLRMRDLERMTKERKRPFSYEHIRKVMAGMPLMSTLFNDIICDILKLDRERMWRLAVEEKAAKNIRAATDVRGRALPPLDARFKKDWELLDADQVERLYAIFRGMVEEQEQRREDDQLADPEKIRAKIIELTHRLTGQQHSKDIEESERATRATKRR